MILNLIIVIKMEKDEVSDGESLVNGHINNCHLSAKICFPVKLMISVKNTLPFLHGLIILGTLKPVSQHILFFRSSGT